MSSFHFRFDAIKWSEHNCLQLCLSVSANKKKLFCVFSQCTTWTCACICFVFFFPQGSQTSNQYIRQLHINHFIGREKKHKIKKNKIKKMCAVRRTQSAKMSGWHFSYWGIRDKIRSVQSTLTGQKLTEWKWTAASQFAEVETPTTQTVP